MRTTEFTFHLRWILWTTGWLLAALHVLPFARVRALRDALAAKIGSHLERRFGASLLTLCLAFIVLGWVGKYSQLVALKLNALDFWLFEDLLRNMNEGGFFLTRFAPQSSGFVQHGAVHGTLTWITALPLSWILGPTQAALFYGPLMLGLAGGVFGLLCAPRLGRARAFAAAAAFLVSTQVGMILNYDVHPEAAYPFFVFLWAWTIGVGDGRVRWIALILATLGGMGIKEDSFLVFFPWMLWGLWKYAGKRRAAAALSFLLGLGVFAFQMHAMNRWSTGAWGPSVWQGLPVKIPIGPDLLKGHRWTSLDEAGAIFSLLLDDHGGIPGALAKLGRFLVSRPWLSLVIFAPWVLTQLRFWITVGPLAAAYSLLQRASILNLYYSAPFLGLFWVNAMLPLRESASTRFRPRPIYSLIAALIFGSASVTIHLPSAETREISQSVSELLPCIEKLKGPGLVHGLVQGHLLGLVPRSRVLTERVSEDPAIRSALHFVLITPGQGSYELSDADASRLVQELLKTGEWKRVAGAACESVNEGSASTALLLVKASAH